MLSYVQLIRCLQVYFYKYDIFWEKITHHDLIVNSNNRSLVLSPDAFYILSSKECVSIPTNLAAEMKPYDTRVGEFRAHYAGFFDPGFGNNKTGTPAVLELRAYDTPFIIRDGQLVGQLNYYDIDEINEKTYGAKIKSNYFS